MAKKVTSKIATKQEQKYLKYKLTKEEVATAATNLAKLLDDKEAIEAELASVKAEFKAKNEKCDAEVKLNGRLVRDGYEHCYIDCDIIYDYGTLKVKTVRKDTGDVVEDRPMTMGEKQMKMDFDK